MNDRQFIIEQGYSLSCWQTVRGGWYAMASSRIHKPSVEAPTKEEALQQLAAIIRSERERYANHLPAGGF